MFKFNDYPSIKEMHKKYLKHDYASTKALINVVDKNVLGAEAKFEKSMNKQDAFNLLYEKVIFDELIKEKPDIFDESKQKYKKWDSIIVKWKEAFPEKWEECGEDQRNDLLGLVLELGYGNYWLPNKYYDHKPLLGCLSAPRTHKKPCDI